MYIVVRHNLNNELYITKKGKFKKIKLKNVYNEHGYLDCPAGYENEEVLSMNYWDGHNWQSVILKSEHSDFFDIERIEREREKEIIKEFKEAKFCENKMGVYIAETKNYIFEDRNRYYAWYIALVIGK